MGKGTKSPGPNCICCLLFNIFTSKELKFISYGCSMIWTNRQVKPGFYIVVSDGDVSHQRMGDAARMLTTIWKRVYSDVPDVPVMSPTSP